MSNDAHAQLPVAFQPETGHLGGNEHWHLFEDCQMLAGLFSSKSWLTSSFSELPRIRPEASETMRHMCVVIGGLSLILSRLPEPELRASFPSTQLLHELLRKQIKQLGKTNATADLFYEVMHEVAEVADPRTKLSLKACFEARAAFDLRREAKEPTNNNRSPAVVSSRMFTDQSITTGQHSSIRPDNNAEPDTLPYPELLNERAGALREAVARARRGSS